MMSSSPMRLLVSLFTQNLGLKLLSLALALVIYHSLKPTEGRGVKNNTQGNDRILFQNGR